MKPALLILALVALLWLLASYINRPPCQGPNNDGINTGNRWTN